jgi:hypothetical protein
MDGTGLRFETMEHGGEYPDTMPQAIKLVDSQGYILDLEDESSRAADFLATPVPTATCVAQIEVDLFVVAAVNRLKGGWGCEW